MPRLLVINDTIARELESLELLEGETLAAALRRLFPEGLENPWSLYAGQGANESLRVSLIEMQDWPVMADDTFTLVRPVTGAAAPFFINLALSLVLGALVKLFTPKPRRNSSTQSEQRESGTTQLAGQTNVLRPGARVPDILGRLRVYPDLLTAAIERWFWPNSQNIVQFFVMGAGDYEIEQAKLGDTPLAQIADTSIIRFRPGDPVALVACRTAPTIDNLSLDEIVPPGAVPASDIQFVASTHAMISPERLSLIAGVPINITGTLYNGTAAPGRDFFVVSVPPDTQTTGPYTYTLDGVVVDEPSVQPTITRYEPFGAADLSSDGFDIYYTAYAQISFLPPASGNPSPGVLPFLCLAEITHGATLYRGRVTEAWYRYDEPTTNVLATDLTIPLDLYGSAMALAPAWSFEPSHLTLWKIPIPDDTGPPTTGPVWTGWYVAPLPDADELWIDIAFPQGLIHYHNNVPSVAVVYITAEFRRVDSATVVSIPMAPFSAARATYLRQTVVYIVDDLGLPPGGAVEVRLKRTSAIPANDTDDQYVTDTRWASFRAVKRLDPRPYPEVTIVQLGLNNTRAASSLGETAFNAVLTRILPTWEAGVWSDPPAPSDKWADNFVARCKDAHGAHLEDAQLDLAGIYALQGVLDDLDGGQQGRIALALDQEQDIDTELAHVADVVRAVVYRVGRKIFVTRDQQTSLRIALFNGRAKSSDAEAVGIRFRSDDDNDAVSVTWVDEGAGWKWREYQYPEGLKQNVLRIAASCANWAQVWRRAAYEWHKLQYRREQLSVPVTEDGRICRPGDVVNVTDDLANLAICAGEVITVAGLTLTLDKDADFSAGGAHTILVRDIRGETVDAIPVTAGAATNQVVLSRAAAVTLKGRDEALGTLYALYADAHATVRPWLVTGVEASGPYVQLTGTNYTDRVYTGDTATLPGIPPIIEVLRTAPPELPPTLPPRRGPVGV